MMLCTQGAQNCLFNWRNEKHQFFHETFVKTLGEKCQRVKMHEQSEVATGSLQTKTACIKSHSLLFTEGHPISVFQNAFKNSDKHAQCLNKEELNSNQLQNLPVSKEHRCKTFWNKIWNFLLQSYDSFKCQNGIMSFLQQFAHKSTKPKIVQLSNANGSTLTQLLLIHATCEVHWNGISFSANCHTTVNFSFHMNLALHEAFCNNHNALFFSSWQFVLSNVLNHLHKCIWHLHNTWLLSTWAVDHSFIDICFKQGLTKNNPKMEIVQLIMGAQRIFFLTVKFQDAKWSKLQFGHLRDCKTEWLVWQSAICSANKNGDEKCWERVLQNFKLTEQQNCAKWRNCLLLLGGCTNEKQAEWKASRCQNDAHTKAKILPLKQNSNFWPLFGSKLVAKLYEHIATHTKHFCNFSIFEHPTFCVDWAIWICWHWHQQQTFFSSCFLVAPKETDLL